MQFALSLSLLQKLKFWSAFLLDSLSSRCVCLLCVVFPIPPLSFNCLCLCLVLVFPISSLLFFFLFQFSCQYLLLLFVFPLNPGMLLLLLFQSVSGSISCDFLISVNNCLSICSSFYWLSSTTSVLLFYKFRLENIPLNCSALKNPCCSYKTVSLACVCILPYANVDETSWRSSFLPLLGAPPNYKCHLLYINT